MITTAKILRMTDNQLVVAPTENITREINQKHIRTVELRLDDGRTISAEQRKKIFALIRDIALWNGDEPQCLRPFLTWDFCCRYGIDFFSLSDVDMTTAREFLSYLIDFCFNHNVPTKDTLLNETDDIGKYLYQCLWYRKCAVCNKPAEVHHVDHVGMGRNRNTIVHVGMKAIALCRQHHEEAEYRGEEFYKENFVYGIKLDKALCEKLKLNTKPRR